MDNKNRPHSREKNVGGENKGVNRRGNGLGTGRVGSKDYGASSGNSANSGHTTSSSGGSGVKRAAVGGGAGGVLAIIIIVFMLLFNNGSCSNLFGSITDDRQDSGGTSMGGDINNSMGGVINNNVAAGSRNKRTQILGGSRDVVTLMIYMCGTDLESKY